MPQQYENEDHIHAVSGVHFHGKSYAYTYDKNGNMTVGWDFTDPTEPARRDILYNVDNMPYRIDRTTGTTTTALELTYDGENSRAKKVTIGGSTTFYINENHELIDGVSHKYIYAGNLRVALIKGSDVYYYHKDHLGSSVIVTEYATGESKETSEYLPYGGFRIQSGTIVSDYKFTDQELDSESGLYNYNARLYDPMIGRFISADSIVPDPYDPQSLNRYSYARNNPLKYVDPDGHSYGEVEQGGKIDLAGETVSGKPVDNSIADLSTPETTDSRLSWGALYSYENSLSAVEAGDVGPICTNSSVRIDSQGNLLVFQKLYGKKGRYTYRQTNTGINDPKIVSIFSSGRSLQEIKNLPPEVHAAALKQLGYVSGSTVVAVGGIIIAAESIPAALAFAGTPYGQNLLMEATAFIESAFVRAPPRVSSFGAGYAGTLIDAAINPESYGFE